jgi:hypothetical protein
LKAIVENVVAFFYPDDLALASRVPQLFDGLPTRFQDVILADMKQLTSLTLSILKSLYPRGNLDVAGEGFAVTCIEDKAHGGLCCDDEPNHGDAPN